MNSYLEVIKTTISFFPLIAFLFAIPFILHNYHKFGSISLVKSIIIYSFMFYLLCAYFLVILPLPTIEEVSKLTSPRVQLIPFKFIYDFVKDAGIHNIKDFLFIVTKPCFYVPIYNIVLTIPFAIYLKYYSKASLKKTILYTFFLSLFFELTQLTGLYFIYPRGYRLFDIDDLLLNTFGGLLGYLLSNPLLKKIPTTEEVNEESREKGIKQVTGFRKLTTLILDIFLIITLWLIIYLINKFNSKNIFIYVNIIYLFIIPTLFKGRTFGELFLNIKTVNKNNNVNILRTYLRRILFIIMYIFIPFIICYIYFLFVNNVETRIKIILAVIIVFILSIYYLIGIIKYIFLKKLMLYEKLSGTKYISTIKETNHEKNNDRGR